MWPEKKICIGERRLVYYDLVNADIPISQPTNPVWELTDYRNGVVESAGDCRIEAIEGGYTLYALITPQHTGLYRLTFIFGIGEELRRPCMIIKVR